MIPLRDVNPTRRRPYVTYVFVALNVAAFFLWQPRGACDAQPPGGLTADCAEEVAFTYCHGAIPAELTDLQAAADAPPATPEGDLAAQLERFRCPDKSVLASLFTSMFLHGGLVHIGGNMLYLWIFGNNVEDRMGHAVFLLFYLAAGVVAAYAHTITDPSSATPVIGASGAIAGVLGAYLVMFPHARVLTAVVFIFISFVELPALLVLGFWFVIQAFQGAASLGTATTGGVAWFAHIGGFLFGLAVAGLFYRRPARPAPPPPLPF